MIADLNLVAETEQFLLKRSQNLAAAAIYTTHKTKKESRSKSKSLRTQFFARMKETDIEKLKKPWMATKSFKLITTEAQLIEYVDNILTDESLWQDIYFNGNRMPAVAVDTETHGLDTRVIVARHEDGTVTYELNLEIAGVCLSADGMSGVYIPVFHEDGCNVPIEVVRRELQRLFDQAHLIFYNAKFDREVMRQTLAIVFRDYPFFEDVQVLNFINDPKAELDDDSFTGGDGLKGLSRDKLGMEQIELTDIAKVKAEFELTPDEIEYNRWCPIRRRANKKDFKALGHEHCDKCGTTLKETITKRLDLVIQPIKLLSGDAEFESRFECEKAECNTKTSSLKPKKPSLRVQYAPFMWVPTSVALWYAAADAICTWLLWDRERREAQQRTLVHEIDGELVDTLTWIERQRFKIDIQKHARLVKWSEETKRTMRAELAKLAETDGWQVDPTNPDVVFNVDGDDLRELLFKVKGFTPTKYTDNGAPSCDAESLMDLIKIHPHDPFLKALDKYKEYVALHPENLSYDKRDNSARIYLKQAVVAGGRLAAAGGKFHRDGGFGLNIQAIKTVGGNWWVRGNVLKPDFITTDEVEERSEDNLDPSCFKEARADEIRDDSGKVLGVDDPNFVHFANLSGFTKRGEKWMRQAPGIIKNHIANFLGFSICLSKGCTSCAEKHGILIHKSKLDANQIMNIRGLFIAQPGYTMFTSDLANIEMRVAANQSREEKFIKEFLEGSGDFHTLTASTVFAEFNDPATTKARRKELRSLAKIINFALLYGGTEYTIYENMKKEQPDITKEQTRAMVEAYWKGVPQFRLWCDGMQKIARYELTCTTATGRIIKFQSAMDALGITVPTKEQMNNYFTYLKYRKQFRLLDARIKEAEELIKAAHTADPDMMFEPEGVDIVQLASDRSEAKQLQQMMDQLYQDKDSGVKNAIDYNKFMSKIQRVSVNVPLQGLAGDFMRMMLNRIRKWILKEAPEVQSVAMFHSSVHDEIDYSVKHAYTPFVVPRVTRLMKLRTLHAERNWPVPVEADTEYGESWDVTYHLTGDDGHKPSGWTNIPGMAEYIPMGFDMEIVNKLHRACISEKQTSKDKAKGWLEANLHDRVKGAIKHIFDAATPEEARKQLFAALHLHEYWTLDQVPDDQGSTMETLAEFEARCGLTVNDRGFCPEDGWMNAVALDKAIRKAVPVLGPPPVEGEEEKKPETPQGTFDFTLEPTLDTIPDTLEPAPAPVVTEEKKPIVEDDEELLMPKPKRKTLPVPEPVVMQPEPETAVAVMEPEPEPEPVVAPAAPPAPEPNPSSHIQPLVLRGKMTRREFNQFLKEIHYGLGSATLNVMLDGEVLTIPKVSITTPIPDIFLELKNGS